MVLFVVGLFGLYCLVDYWLDRYCFVLLLVFGLSLGIVTLLVDLCGFGVLLHFVWMVGCWLGDLGLFTYIVVVCDLCLWFWVVDVWIFIFIMRLVCLVFGCCVVVCGCVCYLVLYLLDIVLFSLRACLIVWVFEDYLVYCLKVWVGW